MPKNFTLKKINMALDQIKSVIQDLDIFYISKDVQGLVLFNLFFSIFICIFGNLFHFCRDAIEYKKY